MNALNRRGWKFGLLAVFLLFGAAGCVQESTVNGEHIFKYALWVPLLVLFGGFVAAPGGWFLREKNSRLGWGLMILGPFAALFMAPSLFMERVGVGDDGFRVRTISSDKEVKFAEIRQIRVTAEVSRGRRGSTTTNYYYNWDLKAGGSTQVGINSALMKDAMPSILQQVSAHDIPILDETQGQ